MGPRSKFGESVRRAGWNEMPLFIFCMNIEIEGRNCHHNN
jgi:hypothetical protein